MKQKRIFITVEGGVVQNVHTDLQDDIEVLMVDKDTDNEFDERLNEEREAQIENDKNIVCIY